MVFVFALATFTITCVIAATSQALRIIHRHVIHPLRNSLLDVHGKSAQRCWSQNVADRLLSESVVRSTWSSTTACCWLYISRTRSHLLAPRGLISSIRVCSAACR
ncbi:hypothetical protein PR003_g16170 [Phytophthora rubi]|uniref:Secreted protein n=1 Tax=Phytophthora rubi TaxID=129364 RepID=A0A6A3KDF9_9STRA|nr:hypothetical protein PR002_g17257 [Phytophthora rubi]KAE9050727.1 hypothetical protein PR001_g2119 [Phytophthora rubi]KAE9326775.1 hypothetical protein PR003_g16170 [Phytophthora rubi]